VSPPDARRGRWKVVAVAGAVVAAAVIGVVVTRTSASHKSATAADRAGPVSATLVRAGDLGDVDDAQGLRAKIEPGLSAQPDAAQRTPPAPGEKPKCQAAARRLQPPGAVLVYEAAARWQHTTADVFGFSPPGSPATSAPGRPTPTRVYVLARADCHLLVFQSFAP
jgi:hypothetical protein